MSLLSKLTAFSVPLAGRRVRSTKSKFEVSSINIIISINSIRIPIYTRYFNEIKFTIVYNRSINRATAALFRTGLEFVPYVPNNCKPNNKGYYFDTSTVYILCDIYCGVQFPLLFYPWIMALIEYTT